MQRLLQADSEEAGSEHLNVMLSGVHGHAGDDELLGDMITWLIGRLSEPAAQVKFKSLAVMCAHAQSAPRFDFRYISESDCLWLQACPRSARPAAVV